MTQCRHQMASARLCRQRAESDSRTTHQTRHSGDPVLRADSAPPPPPTPTPTPHGRFEGGRHCPRWSGELGTRGPGLNELFSRRFLLRRASGFPRQKLDTVLNWWVLTALSSCPHSCVDFALSVMSVAGQDISTCAFRSRWRLLTQLLGAGPRGAIGEIVSTSAGGCWCREAQASVSFVSFLEPVFSHWATRSISTPSIFFNFFFLSKLSDLHCISTLLLSYCQRF